MKRATLLFTYNRSYHTKQVINALKKSKVLPQKLFVFQDGLKDRGDYDEWKKVSETILDIDWCDNEIIISDYNKGLAASIISGINYIFENYDAAIILEDDCVPSANFIGFMNKCFETYEKNKNVYSISGYSWPIQLKKQKYDVYGCGRISSWGWGTWRDRWLIYEKDYEIIKKMKEEAGTSRNLAMWGQDLEDILVGNIRGTCDSWAVFWALNIIQRQGICINPYISLIKNIGMDGSGVHCDITGRYDVDCISDDIDDFCIPDNIVISDKTQKAFATLYGSYTALNDNTNDKEKVVVYGVGNFYLKNEKMINEEYYIEGFIDKNRKGYFAGKKIIKVSEIRNYKFDKLIIMIRDESESLKIADRIKKVYDVPEEKVEFGFLKYK